MSYRTEVMPLVAFPVDNAWAVFRDFETLGMVYITSLTSFATVQVASGLDFDPTNLGTPVTLTFTQAGVTQTVALPVSAASSMNRATRVLPTAGQVSVTFTSPTEFKSFMSNPAATNFSL